MKVIQNIFLVVFFCSTTIQAETTLKQWHDCEKRVQKTAKISLENLKLTLKDPAKVKSLKNKVALRIHPDKCSPADRKKCNNAFVEFNNCIEILTGPKPTSRSAPSKPRTWQKAQDRRDWNAASYQAVNYNRELIIFVVQLARAVTMRVFSPETLYCSCFSEASSCMGLCVWDKTNKCVNRWTSPCKQATSTDVCWALGVTCYWDVANQACISRFHRN